MSHLNIVGVTLIDKQHHDVLTIRDYVYFVGLYASNLYPCYLKMLYQALDRMLDQGAIFVNGTPFSLVATLR
tara:strand:- start:15029 stop:15244 length:216 start_codon:yes stop_codon:yes gene_type:complete